MPHFLWYRVGLFRCLVYNNYMVHPSRKVTSLQAWAHGLAQAGEVLKRANWFFVFSLFPLLSSMKSKKWHHSSVCHLEELHLDMEWAAKLVDTLVDIEHGVSHYTGGEAGTLTVAATNPKRRSCIDWTQCHMLVRGLYFSTVLRFDSPLNPPRQKILPWLTVTPKLLRALIIDDTEVHWSLRGSYFSTEQSHREPS